MGFHGKRRHSGRILLWVLVGLIAVIGAGVGISIYFRDHFRSDPDLLLKLQDASLGPGENSTFQPGDWPQWRGPRRDGVSDETGLMGQWPSQGPRQIWQAKSGGGFSTLVVADNRALTLLQDGDKETVVGWEADTGKEIWRFGYPCKYENSFGSGPRSTPAVDGNRVYVVGATGIFHCLEAATGNILWRHDLLTEFTAPTQQWGVAFSPLVEGDLVFTNPGGPKGNSIAAFDKTTGKLVWKALDDPAAYSSPIATSAAGVKQILFFTQTGLVSVDPANGKEYWRFPWKTNYDCNIATPISVGNYIFISSGYGKGCALLEVSSGKDGTLQARPVYESTRMRNHFSSSVFYKDYLYGFDDANLVCMDFRTGKVQWSKRGFDKGSLLIGDGHLIILGEHGKLALAEATPEEFREQASFMVSHNKCWTPPVLSHGKLYVRDEEQVVCLDVK